MGSQDAVERETAWLRSHGDGLPALHADQDGPFQVIQAYEPRTPQTRETALYVMRNRLVQSRFAQQRKINRHDFKLRLVWPVGASTTAIGLWEAEQAALDAAVELVLQRIAGHLMDHSHGGRFMSVAEAPEPGQITVVFSDPGQGRANVMGATVGYLADDVDFDS